LAVWVVLWRGDEFLPYLRLHASEFFRRHNVSFVNN
jgi:hypothetical protein